MKSRLLTESDGLKTFAVILEQGDEVMSSLQAFAEGEKLRASSFSAVGAFERGVLGWFDWARKDYERIEVSEQAEVLSLLGDVTLDGAKRKVHAHAVLGLRGGTTRGGHLLEGHVRPTLELFLQETAGELRRVFDPRARITLIKAG
jgi:predicted DNA-binding protein with PD1-like motif